MPYPLTTLFAARSKAPGALAPGDEANVEAALMRGLAEARARFPDVTLKDAAFIAHWADSGLPPSVSAHLPELFLVCACLQGEPRAIAALDAQFIAPLREGLSRLRGRKGTEEDVLQELRQRMLMGTTESGPKLSQYAGRGSLQRWLRASAVRLALNQLETRPADLGDGDVLERLADATATPELHILRTRFRAEFSDAFQEALAGLSDDDRRLFRLHLVEGMSIDELAVAFGIHRATAARRVIRTRQQVVDTTFAALRKKLDLADDELDGLMKLLQSQLDLSIQRYLGA